MNYQRMNLINIQIILCDAELELDVEVRNVKMNLFIHSFRKYLSYYLSSISWKSKSSSICFTDGDGQRQTQQISTDSSRHQYCCRENEGWWSGRERAVREQACSNWAFRGLSEEVMWRGRTIKWSSPAKGLGNVNPCVWSLPDLSKGKLSYHWGWRIPRRAGMAGNDFIL